MIATTTAAAPLAAVASVIGMRAAEKTGTTSAVEVEVLTVGTETVEMTGTGTDTMIALEVAVATTVLMIATAVLGRVLSQVLIRSLWPPSGQRTCA